MSDKPKRNDGGPAFAGGFETVFIGLNDGSTQSIKQQSSGMTLRDYFAGQALAGICGDGIPGKHHRADVTAHEAYAYADAMIAAREREDAS